MTRPHHYSLYRGHTTPHLSRRTQPTGSLYTSPFLTNRKTLTLKTIHEFCSLFFGHPELLIISTSYILYDNCSCVSPDLLWMFLDCEHSCSRSGCSRSEAAPSSRPSSESLPSPMSSSSDLSSRAKLNYDSDKFTVEFNVAEYSPEVYKNINKRQPIVNLNVIDSYLTLNYHDPRICISRQRAMF